MARDTNHCQYCDQIQEVIENWTRDYDEIRIGNEFVWDFIQALKGIDPNMMRNLNRETMEDIFKIWWAEHEAEIVGGPGEYYREDSVPSYDTAYAVFLDTWPKVKYAKGHLLTTAINKARRRTQPLPEAQAYTDPEIQLLIHVGYELQLIVGDSEWWITHEEAGNIMGKTYYLGGVILKMLVEDGIFTVVSKHTSTRAARYRYTGPSFNR